MRRELVITSERALGAALGGFLAEAREEANLTQAKLAQKVKLQRQAVGRVEKGLADPSLRSLVRLTKALGVSVIIKAGN